MLSVEEFNQAADRLRAAFPDPLASLSRYHFSNEIVAEIPSMLVRATESGMTEWLDQPAYEAKLILNILDQHSEARDFLHTLFIWADESPITEFANDPPLYLRPIRAQMIANGRPKRRRGRPSNEVRKAIIIAIMSVIVELYEISACGDREYSDRTAYDMLQTAFPDLAPAHATVVEYWKNREIWIKPAGGMIHAINFLIGNPMVAARSSRLAFSTGGIYIDAGGVPNTTERMEGPGFDTLSEVWSTHNKYENLRRYSMQNKVEKKYVKVFDVNLDEFLNKN